MLEELKNIAVKMVSIIKHFLFALSALLAGVGAVSLSGTIMVLVILLICAIGCFFLFIIASVAILAAKVLGLGMVWAFVFFVMLMFLVWG